MSEWTDALALALGVSPLDEAQEASLLLVSRDVAHHAQRKDAPLSAYLAGVAAGVRVAGGATPAEALGAVLETVRSTMQVPGP